MSQRTVTDPNSSNSIFLIIGIAVIAAVAWIVWVVRQQPDQETSATEPVASGVQTPAQPASESIADKCTRLWQANSLGELAAAVQQWHQSSAKDTMAWLLQLPTGLGRDILFATLAPKFTQAEQLDLALAMQSKQARTDLMSETLTTWAKTDAKAALAWTDQHASDTAAPVARVAMLMAWADEQPREAAAYIVTQPKTVLADLLTRWLKAHPSDAAAWAEGLPNDEHRFAAAEIILQHWLPIDEPAVADWVEQIPPSPLRDFSLAALAHHQAKSSPEAARSTAEQISDAAKREACLKGLASATK